MTRTKLPSDRLSSVTELPAVFATQRWVPSEARACGVRKA